jgi:predicted nucleic acid-binding protein
MVIIDTTAWIDFFKDRTTPQTDWLETEMSRQRLGIADIILCEVLQGISEEAEAKSVLDGMERFEVFPTGGARMAVEVARNYRTLRRLGITVRKTIDCWIATFCILEGHSLLHSDRDFDPFERHLGLAVVHP